MHKLKVSFPVGSRLKFPGGSYCQGGVIEITKNINNIFFEYKIVDGMTGDCPPYEFDRGGMFAYKLAEANPEFVSLPEKTYDGRVVRQTRRLRSPTR